MAAATRSTATSPRMDARGSRDQTLISTYYGYSIGKWEGDTLVIDSTSFVDSTWLGRGGLIHSADMHIVERLTRVGNELRYDMTIEDPDVHRALGDADPHPPRRCRSAHDHSRTP